MAIPQVENRLGSDKTQFEVEDAQGSAQQSATNGAYDGAYFQQQAANAQMTNMKTGYLLSLANSQKSLAEKVQM